MWWVSALSSRRPWSVWLRDSSRAAVVLTNHHLRATILNQFRRFRRDKCSRARAAQYRPAIGLAAQILSQKIRTP